MFLKAAELKPISFEAHNNLGMVYGKRAQNAQAIRHLEEAIRLDPSRPRAYTNLGLVYYRMGEKEKARQLWQKSLEIDPDFFEAKRALSLLEGTSRD